MDKMIESTKELMEEQMPSFDFLLDEEAERNSLLAEHRAWLKSIKHERPLPKHPFHVAVYIRYFNQTRHSLHIPFSKLDTPDSITRWNRGELPVALVHPASAGHGLNLQSGGSTLIWFGLTWSLELYQQTNARLWRQGQTAATVVIHHIITKGTIDRDIMAALRRKDKTQSALIAAVKANLTK